MKKYKWIDEEYAFLNCGAIIHESNPMGEFNAKRVTRNSLRRIIKRVEKEVVSNLAK